MGFQLESKFKPTGDQPQAIKKLTDGILSGVKNQVLLGVTGSGKTLAYTVGFLSKINTKQQVQMLIVVPTRELCIQVGKEVFY